MNRVSTCLLLGSLHDKGPEKICNWGQDPHGREEGLAGRRAEGLFTWRWKKTTNRYHGLLIGGGLQVTTGYNFYPSRKLHSCESAGTTCGPVPQPLLLVSSSSLSVLIYFLIPQHGTLQGLKGGFSWHPVNADSECSILESNQRRLGALELLQSRIKSRPPLPLPQPLPSSSCPPLGSCRSPAHSSTCLSLLKKINQQNRRGLWKAFVKTA